jgi:LCP family protein required for cell wall assembly
VSGNSATTQEAVAPEPPPPRRRRLRTRILLAVAALLVVALGVSFTYVYSIDRSVTQNVVREANLLVQSPTEPGQAPRPPASSTAALNYVLLGSDSRDLGNSANGRSDSIMVVHLNAARDRAYVVSFPRDMYVNVPGHGKNKINAAFAYGGPQLTVATLEGLLNVRMDHVVLIDFDGFIRLTDDLGGITVKNRHAFTSHGYRYPKGTITISGEQALWFVRERDSLPHGDLDRAENQRNVIKAIVQKGLSRSVMADPVRYLKFVSGLTEHLTVDSSLSNDEIRVTALSLRLSGDDIETVQAPISGYGTTATGESIDVVDQAELDKLATALRDDKLSSYVKQSSGS